MLASAALFRLFFPPATLRELRRIADYERHGGTTDSADLRRRLARADPLVTTWHSPFLSSEMLAGTGVRAIVHCGGELAARLEPALLDRLTVVNTPEPMAAPVAEMAIALALALVRRLPEHARAMRAGASPDNAAAAVGETLAGRRVGLVGFGRIGRSFAKLLRPFGADLSVYDPHVSASAVRALGGRKRTLDALLRTSSVVVLAAALTRETRGLLDARRLALLADGASIVNVARGGLVDLDALTRELESGRLRAALDVTDPLEPLPQDHRLRQLSNVILTPHVAAGGLEVRHAMGRACVAELERVLRGGRPRRRVTRADLARMT